MTYKDYGQQRHTDETGGLNNFSPNSMVLYVGWGTQLNYKDIPMKNTSIGFGGKFISHDLYLEKGMGFLMDVGIHQRNIVDLIDLDVMLKNWGYSPRIGTGSNRNTYKFTDWVYRKKEFDIVQSMEYTQRILHTWTRCEMGVQWFFKFKDGIF